MKEKDYPHLFVKNIHTKSLYSGIPIKVPNNIPVKDRITQGNFLKNGLNNIWEDYGSMPKVVGFRI